MESQTAVYKQTWEVNAPGFPAGTTMFFRATILLEVGKKVVFVKVVKKDDGHPCVSDAETLEEVKASSSLSERFCGTCKITTSSGLCTEDWILYQRPGVSGEAVLFEPIVTGSRHIWKAKDENTQTYYTVASGTRVKFTLKDSDTMLAFWVKKTATGLEISLDEQIWSADCLLNKDGSTVSAIVKQANASSSPEEWMITLNGFILSRNSSLLATDLVAVEGQPWELRFHGDSHILLSVDGCTMRKKDKLKWQYNPALDADQQLSIGVNTTDDLLILIPHLEEFIPQDATFSFKVELLSACKTPGKFSRASALITAKKDPNNEVHIIEMDGKAVDDKVDDEVPFTVTSSNDGKREAWKLMTKKPSDLISSVEIVPQRVEIIGTNPNEGEIIPCAVCLQIIDGGKLFVRHETIKLSRCSGGVIQLCANPDGKYQVEEEKGKLFLQLKEFDGSQQLSRAEMVMAREMEEATVSEDSTTVFGDKNMATIKVTKFWKPAEATQFPSVGTSFTFKVSYGDNQIDEYTITKAENGLTCSGGKEGIGFNGGIVTKNFPAGTPSGVTEAWDITLTGSYDKYTVQDGKLVLIDYTVEETGVKSDADTISWKVAEVKSGVSVDKTYELQLNQDVANPEDSPITLVTITRERNTSDEVGNGLYTAKFKVDCNSEYVAFADGDIEEGYLASEAGTVTFGISGGNDQFFLNYAVKNDGDAAFEFSDLPRDEYNGVALQEDAPYKVVKSELAGELR